MSSFLENKFAILSCDIITSIRNFDFIDTLLKTWTTLAAPKCEIQSANKKYKKSDARKKGMLFGLWQIMQNRPEMEEMNSYISSTFAKIHLQFSLSVFPSFPLFFFGGLLFRWNSRHVFTKGVRFKISRTLENAEFYTLEFFGEHVIFTPCSTHPSVTLITKVKAAQKRVGSGTN